MADSASGFRDVTRWVIFYPIYINSKKTIAEGRRISSKQGVENPSLVEIEDCCKYLKLPCEVEPHKAYSRDFMQRGRVRVHLKGEDGSPVNPLVPSRKALMIRVAELIPKHQNRAKKGGDTSSSSGSAAASGKSGKSGKKKR